MLEESVWSLWITCLRVWGDWEIWWYQKWDGEVGWAGVQSTLSPAGAPRSRAHCHGAIYSPSSAAPPPPRPSHTAAFSPRPTALPWVRVSAASAAAQCCLLHALACLPCWLVPKVGVRARSQQAASFLIFLASRASDKHQKGLCDLHELASRGRRGKFQMFIKVNVFRNVENRFRRWIGPN